MEKRTNVLWGVGVLSMLAACAAANLVGAWFEYGPATVWNLLMSLAYIAFWVVFTVWARRSAARIRAARVVAVLVLLAGVFSLIASSVGDASPLMIPALLLMPLSAIPLYGLRCFLSWKWLYALCILLGGLWLIALNRIKK